MQFLANGKPALILAPMEGVTDAPMRALQAESGAFTHMVSEFIRVSNSVLPKHSFLTHVPELHSGAETSNGVLVHVQLLGGDPERLAQSALVAVSAGAPAIDLNFGCPAPTVNRHDGGATLLKYPARIRNIIETVRQALPKEVPVSAKLRLGFDSMESIHENADQAAEGGAAWITIHGRTKIQGYTRPAYWEPIGVVRRRLNIPVVANGEIWTLDDFKRCRDQTDCEHFMIGRGALADPALPSILARELGLLSQGSEFLPFGEDPRRWSQILKKFVKVSRPFVDEDRFLVARIKQWVRMANSQFQLSWWERMRLAQNLEEVFGAINGPQL